jgi:hypothetical protein
MLGRDDLRQPAVTKPGRQSPVTGNPAGWTIHAMRTIALTPFEIAERADSCAKRLGSIRLVNRLFRAQDDSDLWPVNGHFNATERAIRRLRRLQIAEHGSLEYALCLHDEIGRIVNQEV